MVRETGDVMNKQKRSQSWMRGIAAWIVDKRNLFFLFYGAMMIFSIFSSGWVKVNDDLTDYL